MNQQNYDKSTSDAKFAKAGKFVKNLHESGIPIDHINKNAWEDSLRPGVYVGKRKYVRFSNRDLQNAVTHYRNLNSKQFKKKSGK